jgi:hypothetical protein
MKRTYRLMICVDVQADSLEEAYDKVHTHMTGTGVAWESSDEAYSPDGEQIPPSVVAETLAQGPLMSNRTQEILIIAGSREGVRYATVREFFLEWVQKRGCPGTIIHGGARGVDAYAERLAAEFQIPIEVFPADWEKHGKKAGPIRNRQMAKHGTAALIIHTGSPGSKSMVREAVEAGLHVHEHEVPPMDEYVEVLHRRGSLKTVWAPALHITERGFLRADFIDRNRMGCSIQESSIADEGCLWLGINGVPATPEHTFTDASGQARVIARMHLTQEHVRGILPLLQLFATKGELRR